MDANRKFRGYLFSRIGKKLIFFCLQLGKGDNLSKSLRKMKLSDGMYLKTFFTMVLTNINEEFQTNDSFYWFSNIEKALRSTSSSMSFASGSALSLTSHSDSSEESSTSAGDVL